MLCLESSCYQPKRRSSLQLLNEKNKIESEYEDFKSRTFIKGSAIEIKVILIPAPKITST